jgi:peroxidase
MLITVLYCVLTAIEKPRVSVTGAPLPSARLVSTTIHWDVDAPDHIHSLMVMIFGQFLDHDLSRTAVTKLTMDPKGDIRKSHDCTTC